ncbi:DUF58 domain-containing protein [Alkalimarinus alittae]|uniref:DUF58 domain-containing protein n=1 Tax=Alkalimarinus alittae TaxID=2961619 RepID=A0ABY6N6S5_9ALTE|nr:DUF58 domain-containing protein [Alkalimarinus alittae]UZE97835.1 DUF58 domain-containing protein [Alkalimarinus alittae]
MKALMRKTFFQWVARRSPVSDIKTLTQRNVYIFPTKEGGLFVGLLLLLLLTAINYQSSLVYLFTFLLGSLFVFSIIFCFKNLSGLHLSLVATNECFVGEEAVYSFALKSKPNQYCESLFFSVPNQPIKKVDISASEVAAVALTIPATHRGLVSLGRIRLETVYPLGLIRAWTWLAFEKQALVFPTPLKGDRSLVEASSGDDFEEGVKVKGEDELSGLRDYALGDSPNRIAWKHYASKGELYVKEFDGVSSSTCWLNYSDYTSGNKEQRLSYLCHDVLDSHRKGGRFGMVFPGGVVEPSSGDNHKMQCLRALALA